MLVYLSFIHLESIPWAITLLSTVLGAKDNTMMNMTDGVPTTTAQSPAEDTDKEVGNYRIVRWGQCKVNPRCCKNM